MFPDLHQTRRESLVVRGVLGFTMAGSSGGWGALAMLVPPVTADEWHLSVLPGLPTYLHYYRSVRGLAQSVFPGALFLLRTPTICHRGHLLPPSDVPGATSKEDGVNQRLRQ